MAAKARRSEWLALLLGLSGALVIGGSYGSLRALVPPTRITAELGLPVVARASITGLHPFPGGLAVDLKISSLDSGDGAGRSQAQAVWFMRKPTLTKNWAETDELVLNGVFVDPALRGRDPKGPTVAAAPVYEFDGKFVAWQSTPADFYAVLRQRLDQAVSSVSGPNHDLDRRLLDSIVFGGTEIDASTKNDFLRAGLLHVLAASGANVLLLQQAVELAFYGLWRVARLPYWLWALTLVALTWFFAGLCGFAPSIVRAAGMSSYVLIGKAVQRRPSLAASLRTTALVEGCWSPSLLASVSSLLSFAATAAIVQAVQSGSHAPRLRQQTRGRKVLSYLGQALRINLQVDLYLIPLTLLLFQQVTPFAVVSNLIAGPLLAILLPLSTGFMLLALLHSFAGLTVWLAQMLGMASFSLLFLLKRVVETVSHWPFALLSVQLPSVWWLIPYYALLWSGNVRKMFVKK
ncbi:MAG: hypothetical protein A2201_13210 [Alicyclobacillus sp. RIFOXYA1_FULL_53_8]|nr:MAG: hypothetical protein A2201_13210 [Alicyclobacillus sp. RIFOXYA1_FULL_53_8]